MYNNYFDESWYLVVYFDVVNVGIDVFIYYKKFGIKEGCFFCVFLVLSDIWVFWGVFYIIDNEMLICLWEYIKGGGFNGVYVLVNIVLYYYFLGVFKEVIILIESNMELFFLFLEFIVE